MPGVETVNAVGSSRWQSHWVDPNERTRRLLFVNESAGTGRSVPDCLKDFDRHDIAQAANILAPVRASPQSNGNLLVATWGGDGTVRTVAQLVSGTNAALLPAPGGSRNHFARSVGLATESDVERALTSGFESTVDVGRIGSEVFLNNTNFGWYTDLVRGREHYEEMMPRRVAKVASAAGQMFRTRRITVTVNGQQERVWMVWIGNGEYSLDPMKLAERIDVADGVLDLRILRAGGRLPKLRALTTLLSPRRQSAEALDRRIVTEATLVFRRGSVRAALDGEVMTLPSPIRIVCDSGALIVRRPPETE